MKPPERSPKPQSDLSRAKQLAREISAAFDVEESEREKAAAIHPARNPEEVLEATQSSTAVLEKFELCKTDTTIQKLVIDIEARLCSYAQNKAYVQALMQTKKVQASELSARYIHGLRELHNACVFELGKLLIELSERIAYYSTYRRSPLATEQGLMQALAIGQVTDKSDPDFPRTKNTETILSLMQQVSNLHAGSGFERFDFAKKELPVAVVVTEPKEITWKNRKATLERTDAVVHNCIAAQAAIPNGFDISAKIKQGIVLEGGEVELAGQVQAYDTVIDWLTEHQKTLKTVNKDEFPLFVEHVNLLHGSQEGVFELLNALETVKQHNPELLMAALGHKPGTNIFTQEAQASNIEQSLLHLGIYNAKAKAAQYAHEKKSLQYSLIQRHVDGLTHFYLSQAMLFQNIEHMKVAAGELMAADGTQAAVVALPLFMRITEQFGMGEAINTMNYNEATEFAIARLTHCGPQEFFDWIKKLPKFILERKEIVEIVQERIFSVFAPPFDEEIGRFYIPVGHPSLNKSVFYTSAQARKIPEEQQKPTFGFVTSIRELIQVMRSDDYQLTDQEGVRYNYNESREPINVRLWQTCDDQALLTIEFAKTIVSISNDQLLQILSAHPHITKEQWQQWYQEVQRTWGVLKDSTLLARLNAQLQNKVLPLQHKINNLANDANIVLYNLANDANVVLSTPSNIFCLMKGMPIENLYSVIQKKVDQQQPLNKRELLLLYGIDSPIEGFEYQKDPQLAKLRKVRNVNADMLVIFGTPESPCTPGHIAHNQQEVNQNTKAYVGPLYPGIFEQLQHLEHIYTKFPENRVRFISNTVGGPGRQKHELQQKLDSQAVYTWHWAQNIMQREAFTTSPDQKEIRAVRLTIADLGFPDGCSTADLFGTAEDTDDQCRSDPFTKGAMTQFGLEFLPAEFGPNYRIDYNDQPTQGSLYMGMEPIFVSFNHPMVAFCFMRNNYELELSARYASPDNWWHPDDEVVFALRKVNP